MVVGSNLSWQGIKRTEYTEGAGLVCECTKQCTLQGSVQGGDRDLGEQNFYN